MSETREISEANDTSQVSGTREMSVSEILAAHEHRPWPLPSAPWIIRQTWHELLFAHWPITPERVRPALPRGLALDTFEGQAWIGVVPFHMTGVRPRLLPDLAGISRFPEINLRTYVTVGGKPGVYFYSLDAGSLLCVELARMFYSLPYYDARFALRHAGETLEYASWRTHRGAVAAEFVGRYRPTGPLARARPGTLERWLTERYCLYTADRRGRLLRAEIHHPQWPLQVAEAEIERETLSRAAGLALPETAPLLHYARRIDVLVWPAMRVAEAEARA